MLSVIRRSQTRYRNAGRGFRRVRNTLAAIACIVAAKANGDAADVVETFAEPLINPIPRQVRFNLVIENRKAQALADQAVWFYAPVKRTATQQLLKLDISAPYELEEDALGNQILKFSFASFPAYGTKIINIKADLAMSATPSKSLIRRSEPFLRDEPYIEKDDPGIRVQAASLKSSPAILTASNIYDWVKTHISYTGFVADVLGARYAFVNSRGDCTEYAYLFTALARANDIPARAVGGYVIDQNGLPKYNEYHNWAEAHIDGAWRVIDAQKGSFQDNAEKYLATRIISGTISNPLNFAHRFRASGSLVVHVN